MVTEKDLRAQFQRETGLYTEDETTVRGNWTDPRMRKVIKYQKWLEEKLLNLINKK